MTKVEMKTEESQRGNRKVENSVPFCSACIGNSVYITSSSFTDIRRLGEKIATLTRKIQLDSTELIIKDKCVKITLHVALVK